MKLNRNFFQLSGNYLFTEVGRRVRAYRETHPTEEVISMGIGDVTLPLPSAVAEAFARAAGEMGERASFRGYGPEQGYLFLREAVAGYYEQRGIALTPEEIYIGDGAKSDFGNFLDLFGRRSVALIPDPAYPAYVDANTMAGRRVAFLRGSEDNGFLPMPGSTKAHLIYLCSPNNPTGAAYTKEQLSLWVEFAQKNDAIILFDAAYEAFVTEPGVCRSVFEVPGARTCAVEFCSLSKTAGFTGMRCGYTVIPKELKRSGAALGALWLRRQSTKFNGVAYAVQRAAEAVFSPEGLAGVRENLAYYRANAALLSRALAVCGLPHTGGVNSPYLWFRCPGGMDSWAFFDALLGKCRLVGTPGAGFGACGEGYFRLTAFSSRENTQAAAQRLAAFRTS